MNLGHQIRMLRQERGWTLKELGERAEVSVSYLSDVEREKVKPSGNLLGKIADVFEVEVDLLAREAFQGARINGALVLFAREARLTNEEVLMLARLKYRKERPQTVAAYRHLWSTIRLVCEGTL